MNFYHEKLKERGEAEALSNLLWTVWRVQHAALEGAGKGPVLLPFGYQVDFFLLFVSRDWGQQVGRGGQQG